MQNISPVTGLFALCAIGEGQWQNSGRTYKTEIYANKEWFFRIIIPNSTWRFSVLQIECRSSKEFKFKQQNAEENKF